MSAKDLVLKPITRSEADAVIKREHYSGKVVQNSQIHMGIFFAGRLEGALQFGPSLDKRKMLGLVTETPWNGFLELNRMALSEALPPNSESRSISIAMKLLGKYAPKVQWVVSFADGTQCGDGTIYRASGFVLTGIKKSANLIRLPDQTTIHKMTLESNPKSARKELGGRSYYDITGGRYDLNKYVSEVGGTVIPGFQLRYIYFLHKSARERLTVPIIPFSEINKLGAGMYLGLRRGSVESDTSGPRSEEGSASLTSRLRTDN